MLLRSSSTPILGSLVPSISESPNNNFHCENHPTNKHPPTTIYQKHHSKLSFNQTGTLNIFSSSCNSSPMSASVLDRDRQGFRRAQSEGNLQGLVHASYDNENQVSNVINSSKSLSMKVLEPIPSFSRSNSMTSYEEEEEEFDIEELGEQKGTFDMKIKDEAVAREDHLLDLRAAVKCSSTNVDEKWQVSFKNGKQTIEGMYLARGLGLESFDACGHGCFGGGDDGVCNLPRFGGDGGDGHGVEEYYKRMVEENPGNALFLRNYAQFLYQSKRDLRRADEYYSRAILADSNDGEVLSQYAKLIWELNHDRDRAASYHERAVEASPEDSYVHAAYAGFLWETEEDEDSCNVLPQPCRDHEAVLASAGA